MVNEVIRAQKFRGLPEFLRSFLFGQTYAPMKGEKFFQIIVKMFDRTL